MNSKHAQAVQAAATGRRPHGHAHFWERAALTRRQFLTAGAASVAVAAFGGLWEPARANAAPPVGALPRPIPGGTQIGTLGFFHFYFPTLGNPPGSTHVIENGTGDPSTITDFNGKVGVSEMSGGTGVDNLGHTQYWKSDVRFMDGEYVDVDGEHRQGTIAFV